ncbi:MAG: hypothetical protein ACP6IY_18695 [Promethearchaeia archaeon]
MDVQHGNQIQKAIGHELAHCLNIHHHEYDIEYGDNGYEIDEQNYMSRINSNVYYIENLKFEEWQWKSFRLNDIII